MPSILTLPLGATVSQPVSILGKPSLLSQILSGVQAGELAIAGYYQGQATINAARLAAEQAKYPKPGEEQQQVYAASAGGGQQFDTNTMLMIGAGLLLVMMMSQSKRR